MSREVLEGLTERLLAMPVVRAPDLPVAVSFQEAAALIKLTEREEVGRALLEVGLDAQVLDDIRTALAAARQAESQWTSIRSRRKPEDQRDVEEQGRALRATAISASRFSLRRHRGAQGALNAIEEGEGVADLVQDLFDTAELIERNLAAFAANRRFNAAATVMELRRVGNAIEDGQAEFATDTTQKNAVDLRNRAWTLLDDLVTEIRQAGQHAFEGTPTAREFGSDYERTRRRTARRRSSTMPAAIPAPDRSAPTEPAPN